MSKITKSIIIIKIGIPACLLFLLFMVMFSGQSSGGSDAVLLAANDFSIPFRNRSLFTITSPFGYREDPYDKTKTVFHSGIDLGASEGTDVLATADGIIEKVGFEENGLGNYVIIRHELFDEKIYSGYGHMLDNSIIVVEKQQVKQGDKIGSVGSTGASTGFHLHFMLMKGKISYNEEDLIDPTFVITGLDEEEQNV